MGSLQSGMGRIVAPVAATCRNGEKGSSFMARIAVHPERERFAMELDERLTTLEGTSSGGEPGKRPQPARKSGRVPRQRPGIPRERPGGGVSISESTSVVPTGSFRIARPFSPSSPPRITSGLPISTPWLMARASDTMAGSTSLSTDSFLQRPERNPLATAATAVLLERNREC